jgi:hypothetical protein
MEFKNELIALLKDKSDITRKTYIDRIASIKKLIEYDKDDLNFLKNDKKIIKFIDNSELKLSTKKINYISLAVITALQDAENKTNYYNKMMEYKIKNNDERQENEVSNEISKNWASYDDLKKMYEKMPEETAEEIQEKALIALYVLQPPLRNDYAKIKVMNRSPRTETNNYMIVQKNKIEFCINQHKTADNFGAISLNYDNNHHQEIYRILKKWFEHNKTNYLFIKISTQRALNENDLSKLIPAIFEKNIKKHITIQLLRQIFETEEQNKESYINGSMKDRKEVHDKLKHSSNVAMEYRKIINKKKTSVKNII